MENDGGETDRNLADLKYCKASFGYFCFMGKG